VSDRREIQTISIADIESAHAWDLARNISQLNPLDAGQDSILPKLAMAVEPSTPVDTLGATQHVRASLCANHFERLCGPDRPDEAQNQHLLLRLSLSHEDART
jgi:hypothetical protein